MKIGHWQVIEGNRSVTVNNDLMPFSLLSMNWVRLTWL